MLKDHVAYNPNGFIYAFRILAGCAAVWWLLDLIPDSKKIWAVITVIVVTEPDLAVLRTTSMARLLNTLVGCVIGMLFLLTVGANVISLFGAIALSVIISTSFKNYPASWKLSPATTTIVTVPAILSKEAFPEIIDLALHRILEVVLGCVVAFVLGYLIGWGRRLILGEAAAAREEKKEEIS